MDDRDRLKNKFEKSISEKDLSKYTHELGANPDDNLVKHPINITDIRKQNILNSTIGSNSELLNSENISFERIECIQIEKKDEIKLIDKIISEYGYKIQIIKIIIISFFLNFISNYILFHVSSNLLVLEKSFSSDLNMSTENTGIFLSSISYISKAIGCISFIFLTKSFSRQTFITISLIIIFALNVLVSVSFNLWTYLAFIILGCFCSGIIDPINSDVLCETLPIRLRGFFMCVFSLGSPFSQTLHFIFLNKIYVESKGNFQEALFAGSFLILLLGLFIILFFEDSPRNLILREDLIKAHSQLEKFLNPTRSLTDSEKNILYTQMHYGLNNRLSKCISSIFSPLFLRTTLLFIGIVVCIKSIDDGMSAVLTLYIQKILGSNDDNLIGLEGIKINAFGMLGPIISGVLIEVKYLGRKLTLMISAILLLLCYVLFQVNIANYILWLGLLTVFCNSSTSNLVTLITETYPTILRDISEGFFNCVSALGSLIGNLVFLSLFKLNNNAPFYFQIGNGFVSLILVFFIKYDTCQKQLDVFTNNNDSEEENTNNEREELKSLV